MPRVYEYQKQFFGFKKWNLVWTLLILGIIALMKVVRKQ